MIQVLHVTVNILLQGRKKKENKHAQTFSTDSFLRCKKVRRKRKERSFGKYFVKFRTNRTEIAVEATNLIINPYKVVHAFELTFLNLVTPYCIETMLSHGSFY